MRCSPAVAAAYDFAGAGTVVFCNSMARVWGLRAQAVGNVLTVFGFSFGIRHLAFAISYCRYAFSSSRRAMRARNSLLFNVPSGRPRMSAICW